MRSKIQPGSGRRYRRERKKQQSCRKHCKHSSRRQLQDLPRRARPRAPTATPAGAFCLRRVSTSNCAHCNCITLRITIARSWTRSQTAMHMACQWPDSIVDTFLHACADSAVSSRSGAAPAGTLQAAPTRTCTSSFCCPPCCCCVHVAAWISAGHRAACASRSSSKATPRSEPTAATTVSAWSTSSSKQQEQTTNKQRHNKHNTTQPCSWRGKKEQTDEENKKEKVEATLNGLSMNRKC